MANNIQELSQRFELICERILIANQYRVVLRQQRGAVDFVVREPKTEREVAVEVKLYRSLRVDRSVLQNAAVRVAQFKEARGTKALLIGTTLFNKDEVEFLQGLGIDDVWGLLELGQKASKDALLAPQLRQLLRDQQLLFL